jgi:hypothetical protein
MVCVAGRGLAGRGRTWRGAARQGKGFTFRGEENGNSNREVEEY